MNQTDRIPKKILSKERLTDLCSKWKLDGLTVVFTNGCFDILHSGHLELLTQSASLGDKLIVALNSDASIKRLKGDLRPIHHESFRCWMMASLEIVDAVVLFDEQTPLQLIGSFTPTVLVKGGDYAIDQVVGAEHVLSNGGKVEIIPFVNGYSTTNIIEKIQKL
ncbi:MAG: D-glycero-beta-D-manno-heptose 1-phosphate adenylyltransferase [Sphingobacteriales bacterium]|jgi:rfaE bifunctional protein nucleotidyltransferase chain/domain